MTNVEDVTEPKQLREVRDRRRGLRRTMTEVEEAISAALSGRPADWRATLEPRIGALRDAWSSHIAGTEGPAGLWEQVRTDAPRLDGHLRRLGREHQALAAEIAAVGEELAAAGDDENELARVREHTVAVLGRLSHHRQQGADLIYEAYTVDVGGRE